MSFNKRRILCGVIDFLFLYVLTYTLQSCYFDFISENLAFTPWVIKLTLYRNIDLLVVNNFFTLSFGYFTMCFYSFQGTTLGGLITQIRIQSENYQDPTLNLNQATIRAIGMWGTYLTFGILHLFSFWSAGHKSFNDFFSQTIAVDKRLTTATTIIALPYNESKSA